jgi:hypothetical protein
VLALEPEVPDELAEPDVLLVTLVRMNSFADALADALAPAAPVVPVAPGVPCWTHPVSITRFADDDVPVP